MVLSDVTNDYAQFIDLLEQYNEAGSYINSALAMINEYQAKITRLADVYLRSSKGNADTAELTNGLKNLRNAFADQIADMSCDTRSTTRLITEIERLTFVSPTVRKSAEVFCSQLNTLMDTTEIYAANEIRRKANTGVFFQLIDQLEEFKNVYLQIYSSHDFLKSTEEELLGELPPDISEEDEIACLEIRSTKNGTDLYTFADDLKLLSESLIQLEMLVVPAENHTIFIRKIESGSLKAEFGSIKIDLSIIRDLVESISNAIRSWRMTPSDIRRSEAEANKADAEANKINAEAQLLQMQAEAQHIRNEGARLAIAKAQIDYVCEKLNLDAQDNHKKEQIEQLCVSLIKYLEQNPSGSVNGFAYDISKETKLLDSE